MLNAKSVQGLRYRCAYEASGNGIVERNHRTIKTAVARSRCSVEDAVYWYNATPKDSSGEATAPASEMYRYRVRVRPVNVPTEVTRQATVSQRGHQSYAVGDVVWVRRRGSRCSARSQLGRVTTIISDLSIEVDGVPRHVRNLRLSWQSAQAAPQQQNQQRSTSDDDGPLLVHLPPSTAPHSEGAPAVQQSPMPVPEVPPTQLSRTPFTLPSRSAVRCLRANPPTKTAVA